MRYIVGYTADRRGRQAINLAAGLARAQDIELVITLVLPTAEPFEASHPQESGYRTILAGQARTWLDEARSLVPEGVSATVDLRYAHTEAAGLLRAGHEHGAAAIIIGAARRSITGLVSTGKVADELFATADLPVAIAPAGHEHPGPLSRVTVLVGDRPGTEPLLEVAAATALSRGIELRVISLLALGDTRIPDPEQARRQAETRRAQLLERLGGAEITVTSDIAHGETIEDAVTQLPVEPGELILLGSSRLAAPRRLRLGSTAKRVLAGLSVPMVMVPKDYQLPRHLDPGIGAGTGEA